MAPHDEEDDPAVYRSGSRKKRAKSTNGHKASPGSKQNGDSRSHGSSEDEDIDDGEDDGDDDDGTLLTVQPGYNRLPYSFYGMKVSCDSSSMSRRLQRIHVGTYVVNMKSVWSRRKMRTDTQKILYL